MKNCLTSNYDYHIEICRKNGSWITQEGDEKSMQHEGNMRRADDLEGWAEMEYNIQMDVKEIMFEIAD